MQLTGDTYSIVFDKDLHTLFFSGSLRLENVQEYQKIHKFILDVHELDIPELDLDFEKVEFLNSSGIAMLCKYILDAKKLGKLNVKIIGNSEILWQKKSFMNLKQLWDKVEVVFRAQ